MIKTIIFDNNGVLTDKNKLALEFSKYFNVSFDEMSSVIKKMIEAVDLGGITTTEFFQNISQYFNKNYNLDELFEVFLSCYDPYADIRSFLIDLKQRCEIALLSNFGDAFDFVDKRSWNYRDIFSKDKIFVSYKLGMIKPNEDIYLYTLEKLGRKPEETVFIDDNKDNVETARGLGMNVIHFTNLKKLQQDLAKYIKM